MIEFTYLELYILLGVFSFTVLKSVISYLSLYLPINSSQTAFKKLMYATLFILFWPVLVLYAAIARYPNDRIQ